MKKNDFQIGEIIILITLGLFSLGVFWNSYAMYRIDMELSSSGVLPLFVSLSMLISIIILIISKMYSRSLGNDKSKEDLKHIMRYLFNNELVVSIVSFIAFIYLVRVIGFYIAAIVFLIFTIGYLTKGKYFETIKYSVLFVAIIWIIFGSIFKVILP